MVDHVPQIVDRVNPSIGGLPPNVERVTSGGMSAKEQTRPDHAEIGHRLASIRQAFSDLDQKAWALRHGFTVTQWNNWERGERRIPVESAERLCDLYGVTLDFIYRGRRDGISETASKVL